MTDMVIPPEAVRDAEKAWRRAYHAKPFTGDDHSWMRAALEAALPHLRPMLERVVEVHHHDIEKHAESFNEGYDEANRQGIGGEASRNWLTEKVWPLLKDHIEPENSHHVADQIADALLSEADLSDPDTKALVETATRLGRELGRREAAEEIAQAIESWNSEDVGGDAYINTGRAASIAREIATKEDPA